MQKIDVQTHALQQELPAKLEAVEALFNSKLEAFSLNFPIQKEEIASSFRSQENVIKEYVSSLVSKVAEALIERQKIMPDQPVVPCCPNIPITQFSGDKKEDFKSWLANEFEVKFTVNG